MTTRPTDGEALNLTTGVTDEASQLEGQSVATAAAPAAASPAVSLHIDRPLAPGPAPDERPGSSTQAKVDATTIIHLQGVSFYYGTFRAIRDIDMSIPANRITALIGPSG